MNALEMNKALCKLGHHYIIDISGNDFTSLYDIPNLKAGYCNDAAVTAREREAQKTIKQGWWPAKTNMRGVSTE